MTDKNVKKFVNFYNSNLKNLYRFCYLKTKDSELSKDISQKSFLKTWIYVKQGEDVNIKALVYKIANNLIIDWYRKKKEESLDSLLEEGFDVADNQESTIENSSLESTLKILDELPDDERELILFRYVNMMKPREIAEILEENVNVVSVRIHRARKRLKKIIDEKGYELF